MFVKNIMPLKFVRFGIFLILMSGCVNTKEESNCGTRNVEIGRIVGGHEAIRNSWPWHVALAYKDDLQVFCGGSILSSRWVITAAHCLYGALEARNKTDSKNYPYLDQFVVITGLHNTSAAADNINTIFETTRISYHSQYTNDPLEFADLALIKVKQEITFNSKMKPICFPTQRALTKRGNLQGKTCTITGWGLMNPRNPNSRSNVLLEAEVVIKDDGGYGDYIKRILNITCPDCKGYIAASGNETDTCQGDSGGALQCEFNNKWYIVGITSFGIGCGDRDHPGVYTRIVHFKKYVQHLVYVSKNG